MIVNLAKRTQFYLIFSIDWALRMGQRSERSIRRGGFKQLRHVPHSAELTNRQRNLGFFFDAAREHSPDKVAVIDLFGGRVRVSTYAHLSGGIDELQRWIAE